MRSEGGGVLSNPTKAISPLKSLWLARKIVYFYLDGTCTLMSNHFSVMLIDVLCIEAV